MKEPRFAYGQEVEIIKGFYRGQVGIIKQANIDGLFFKSFVYFVDVEGLSRWLLVREDQLAIVVKP